jgi:hypothetical protein
MNIVLNVIYVHIIFKTCIFKSLVVMNGWQYQFVLLGLFIVYMRYM